MSAFAEGSGRTMVGIPPTRLPAADLRELCALQAERIADLEARLAIAETLCEIRGGVATRLLQQNRALRELDGIPDALPNFDRTESTRPGFLSAGYVPDRDVVDQFDDPEVFGHERTPHDQTAVDFSAARHVSVQSRWDR